MAETIEELKLKVFGSYENGIRKYHPMREFRDPVIRCDSCSELMPTSYVTKYGMCSRCGASRMRNVRNFTIEELAKMKEWGVDPDFLALFGEIPDPEEMTLEKGERK